MKYHLKPNRLTTGKLIGRISIIISILLISIVILFFSAMGVIFHGPSKTARDIFVTTCMETSFAKIFPPLYLSNQTIETIKKTNSVVLTDEVTNTATEFVKPDTQINEQKDIEVLDIIGSTYKGKLMIVKDPSRICVAAPQKYGKEEEGEKLADMIKKEDAVAGINGGGFVDENGVGSGGMPLGVVVKNSQFLFGEGGSATSVIGFDENNVLHVGTMSTAQIKERKIRDAVSFGPALIINSNPVKTIGNSGGLNPRTAIGQRADGSVLLLVIDGRQPHSLGATYKDLVDIMVEHKAINAGNLDGGSSSMLYYNGELISTCASLYGPRKIPTGFVVK